MEVFVTIVYGWNLLTAIITKSSVVDLVHGTQDKTLLLLAVDIMY